MGPIASFQFELRCNVYPRLDTIVTENTRKDDIDNFHGTKWLSARHQTSSEQCNMLISDFYSGNYSPTYAKRKFILSVCEFYLELYIYAY